MNSAVTNDKLATDAVTAVKIMNNAIVNDKILDGTIENNKLACNPGGPALGLDCVPQIPNSKLEPIASSKLLCDTSLNLTCTPDIPTTKLTGLVIDSQIQSISGNKITCPAPIPISCFPVKFATDIVIKGTVTFPPTTLMPEYILYSPTTCATIPHPGKYLISYEMNQVQKSSEALIENSLINRDELSTSIYVDNIFDFNSEHIPREPRALSVTKTLVIATNWIGYGNMPTGKVRTGSTIRTLNTGSVVCLRWSRLIGSLPTGFSILSTNAKLRILEI